MQVIIPTIVRRIEIDDSRIEVIFRVPSQRVHRDQNHRPNQSAPGNIVEALVVERTFATMTAIAIYLRCDATPSLPLSPCHSSRRTSGRRRRPFSFRFQHRFPLKSRKSAWASRKSAVSNPSVN